MEQELGTPELDDEKIAQIFEGFGTVEEGTNGANLGSDYNTQERWSLAPKDSESEAGDENEMPSNATREEMSVPPHRDLELEALEPADLDAGTNVGMLWSDPQQQSLAEESSLSMTAITQHARNLALPLLPAVNYSRSSFRGKLPWPAMEEIKELPEPLLPAVTLSGLPTPGEEKELENQDPKQAHPPELITHAPTNSNAPATNHISAPTTFSNHTTYPDDSEAEKVLCQSRPSSSKSELDPQTTESATFKLSKKGIYTPLAQSRLRNNLLASVGFLEFGNATDFAANVWNTIPVPIYAAVLMGLGGAVAIILSFFAVRDAVLSWRNVRILRGERAMLIRRDKSLEAEEGKIEVSEVERTAAVDAMRLEVNRRELGSEIIDRFSMDILMGFGAFIVGVGTELAIGGANPHVYRASNLLSGYIGNTPSLLWGLCNTLWSIYVFKRAGQHLKFGLATLESQIVKERLRSRVRLVRMHAFTLGVATLVSGPGGMVTVTRWWGYVMLIPCIIGNIWGNFLWRSRIGYERPLARMREKLWSRDEIVEELEWVLEVKRRVSAEEHISLTDLLRSEMLDARTIVDFIARADLFEDFCGRLLKDETFTKSLEDTPESEFTILTTRTILATSSELSSLILSTAELSLMMKGRVQLAWKERYLFEMLGARLCLENGTFQTPGTKEARAQSRRASHATDR
jgi:hypothetical protein